MIRLAALGLWHEANTFSAQVVDLAKMEATGVLRGQEIVAQHAGGTSTMSGYSGRRWLPDLVLRAVRREVRPTAAMEAIPAVVNILRQIPPRHL